MRYGLCGLLILLLSLTGIIEALAAPQELDWLELMPAEDRQALEDMPEIDHITPEAQGFSDQQRLKQGAGLPEVMYSGKTVAALHNKSIRLAGYVVPLEQDAKGRMTQFFLVPYPGACIHVPPPPPNQIVLVHYPKGFALKDLYDPLWVEGILKIDSIQNDLADAAYRLEAKQVRALTD